MEDQEWKRDLKHMTWDSLLGCVCSNKDNNGGITNRLFPVKVREP